MHDKLPVPSLPPLPPDAEFPFEAVGVWAGVDGAGFGAGFGTGLGAGFDGAGFGSLHCFPSQTLPAPQPDVFGGLGAGFGAGFGAFSVSHRF